MAHILTQNLYYNYFQSPKYPILGYMDPDGKLHANSNSKPLRPSGRLKLAFG